MPRMRPLLFVLALGGTVLGGELSPPLDRVPLRALLAGPNAIEHLQLFLVVDDKGCIDLPKTAEGAMRMPVGLSVHSGDGDYASIKDPSAKGLEVLMQWLDNESRLKARRFFYGRRYAVEEGRIGKQNGWEAICVEPRPLLAGRGDFAPAPSEEEGLSVRLQVGARARLRIPPASRRVAFVIDRNILAVAPLENVIARGSEPIRLFVN
jgi:hypothetical protein